MGDPLAKAKELEERADKKLKSWDIFGWNHVDAVLFYDEASRLYAEAAKSFKRTKSWNEAGAAYVSVANCYIKLDMKYQAAYSYSDASQSYKRSKNIKEAITCMEQCINMFLETGMDIMTSVYYEEIAKLYEQELNLGKAIYNYDKAAEVFESGHLTRCANKCRQKVAQLAFQLEQ